MVNIGGSYRSKDDPKYCLRIAAAVGTASAGPVAILEDGLKAWIVQDMSFIAADFKPITPQEFADHVHQVRAAEKKAFELEKA